MRYFGIILFGFICLLAGWLLHGFFYPDQLQPTKESPAKGLTPSQQLPRYQQTYDLGGYNAEPSTVESKKETSSTGKITALLRTGNYRDAVALYGQRLNTVSEQESNQSRHQILQYAQELFQSGSYANALQLLNHYLEIQFRDVDALLLKANVLDRQKEYNGQIDVLYDAKSYAYQQPVIARITDDIRSTVDSYQQHLLKKKRYTELLELFQKLVYLEPDYSPYFIELAKAQRANRMEQEARQSLQLVLYDPVVGMQAKRLLAESSAVIDEDETPTIANVDQFNGIPLQRRGSHFVVEATLNGYTPLRLIIDTGASLTIIKTDRLRAALRGNLSQYPEHMFNTANGMVKAPVLPVNSLAIGEFEVTNLQVGGLTLVNTEDVDGLLGMNFLKHYRFFIDQQNNLLRLSLNSDY